MRELDGGMVNLLSKYVGADGTMDCEDSFTERTEISLLSKRVTMEQYIVLWIKKYAL